MASYRPLLLLLLLAASCGDPVGPRPEIRVDACATPVDEGGGFEDCELAFGSRDVSVRVNEAVRLTNPSSVELTLLDVAIVGDPAFTVELAPATVAPASFADVIVAVRPGVESSIEAMLAITSDASNTRREPSVVEIALSAQGVDNGLPDIDVAPAACDAVVVGARGDCVVRIANTGNRTLHIDDIAFKGAMDAAFSLGTFAADVEVGDTLDVSVAFAPAVAGTHRATLQIVSSDPDEGLIDVDIAAFASVR